MLCAAPAHVCVGRSHLRRCPPPPRHPAPSSHVRILFRASESLTPCLTASPSLPASPSAVMCESFQAIWELHTEDKIPLRTAAFVKALQVGGQGRDRTGSVGRQGAVRWERVVHVGVWAECVGLLRCSAAAACEVTGWRAAAAAAAAPALTCLTPPLLFALPCCSA